MVRGLWVSLWFGVGMMLSSPGSHSVLAYIEDTLTVSPYLNPPLTQYDLNLRGFSNPVNTPNTEIPDKCHLKKYTLYVPGIQEDFLGWICGCYSLVYSQVCWSEDEFAFTILFCLFHCHFGRSTAEVEMAINQRLVSFDTICMWIDKKKTKTNKHSGYVKRQNQMAIILTDFEIVMWFTISGNNHFGFTISIFTEKNIKIIITRHLPWSVWNKHVFLHLKNKICGPGHLCSTTVQ